MRVAEYTHRALRVGNQVMIRGYRLQLVLVPTLCTL